MGTPPTVSLRVLTEEVRDAVTTLPRELMDQEPFTAGSVPTLQAQVKDLYSRIKDLILTGKAADAVPDNIQQVRWAAEILARIEQKMQLLISTAEDHTNAKDVRMRFELRNQWSECVLLIENLTEDCVGALSDFLVLVDTLDGGMRSSRPDVARPARRSGRSGRRSDSGEVGEAS